MHTLSHQQWPDNASFDDHLRVDGVSAQELAEAYGTPLYVLDQASFEADAARYVEALRTYYPAAWSVHYAGKALLNTGIARIVAAAGLDLDCVSLGELAVARHAGIDPAHAHLHGNAKPPAELAQAIAWGVGRIMVDSLDELDALAAIAPPTPQPIMLRLNPGVDVHTHAHIQTGQLDSKFGLPIATGMAQTAVERALATPGIELTGLHAHLGSQITELDALARGVDRLIAFAAAMRDRLGWTMRDLSPGGGLAVAYRDGDPVVAIQDYVRTLADAVQESCARYNLALPRLIIEPGRSLIARNVVTLYRVLSVKRIAGVRTFVAVDGGMGDNIRPALYEARYTALRADPSEADTETVHLVGRYCESGDILVRDAVLPRLEPGALVAIAMTGAYTLSMASTYNLVPRPALVAVKHGAVRVLQRRETIEDLVARDLP